MSIPKSNISLIEDHHQALAIWREKGFKNFDLVHIDAHIDFGFHSVKPKVGNGIITSELLGRKFVVCILEKLPVLKQKALLASIRIF